MAAGVQSSLSTRSVASVGAMEAVILKVIQHG